MLDQTTHERKKGLQDTIVSLVIEEVADALSPSDALLPADQLQDTYPYLSVYLIVRRSL